MKKLATLLGMVALVFSTSAANADTFTVDINQSWTSTTSFTVDFDFPANASGEIDSINSISIDITHTFASDLGFELNGGGSTGFDLIDTQTAGGGLDVAGLEFVQSGTAPYADIDGDGFVDNVPYSALTWDTSGGFSKTGWSFTVVDDFAGDGGTVNSITIDFDKGGAVPEPASALALLGLGSLVAIRRRR